MKKNIEKSEKHKKALMEMALHDVLKVDQIYITRVPGGWIYDTPNKDMSNYFNSTFVPIPQAGTF